ncbi:MAG: aminotransferase class V-fold PLP-dependent enzyme [Candidatus Limnocylindrales bacterium]
MSFVDRHPDLSVAALQALVPGTSYFNVAGSGPTFPVAQAAAERYRTWLNGVGMFSHVGYDAYNDDLAATRADLAAFLGDPDGAGRVALMQSATDGLNTLVAGLRLPPDALLVTTAEEHASALLPVYRRQDRGDRVRVIAYGDDAAFLEQVASALADGAAALVLSLVSCKSGRVLPVAAACGLARAAGAATIVDCAQALGQLPFTVRDLGADAAVFLGHKWLHGPLATGAIWVGDLARFDPPRLGWRSRVSHGLAGEFVLEPDARRFETGTVDVAAYVGLRQALAVHRGLGTLVPGRIATLRERLLAALGPLPFRLLGRPEDPTGIVVVAPRTGAAFDIVQRMWVEERIVVKHIADPGMPDAIRLSFWALHSEDDIDRLAAALARQTAPVAAG